MSENSPVPAAACTVRRSPFAGAWMLGLWLPGALLAVRMAIHPDEAAAGSGWRMAVVALAVIGCGAFAALCWLRAPQGTLCWDGQGWWWRPQEAQERSGAPRLRLDLQTRLLVRWRDSVNGRVSWFWLQDSAADSARSWHALRCALQVRPHTAPDTLPDGRTPATVPIGARR